MKEGVGSISSIGLAPNPRHNSTNWLPASDSYL